MGTTKGNEREYFYSLGTTQVSDQASDQHLKGKLASRYFLKPLDWPATLPSVIYALGSHPSQTCCARSRAPHASGLLCAPGAGSLDVHAYSCTRLLPVTRRIS